MSARHLLVASVILFSAGCGKSSQPAINDRFTAEEMAIAREDERVGNENLNRLKGELQTAGTQEQRMTAFTKLVEIEIMFSSMTKCFGLPGPARAFREATEGKTAEDFLSAVPAPLEPTGLKPTRQIAP